ncbi:MAG: 50S ribosomal protein L30 [Chloroflexi bacterium]|jgi:large subunit ribosomal protein L30|nr:50S ribosomal protein L30 [Chloroflexota bacterium]|tara:strand:+ start:312 stop:497 length:186 start_codon:yes stop_codon:yes gene_type:complete
MNKNKIEIKLFKSPIGSSKKQKKILDSLGLRKLNQIIAHNNKPEILGMIKKVKHLVKIIQE